MTLSMKPAIDYSLSELAALFTLSFTGYIGGNFTLDRDSLHAMITRDNTDLSLSRVLLQDETPAGFILIARQGWTSRVAAMGIIPDAQNQGVGRWFLSQVIEETRARGEHTLVLEAIEQNERAVALYKRLGFRVVRRLMGYDASTLESMAAPDLREIDPYALAKAIITHGTDDLPWQVSGTALARAAVPSRAFQLGHASALISNPDAPTIALRALIVEPGFRRQGEGTRLVKALAAQFPGKAWTIVPLSPEEHGDFFISLGFVPKALNQVQMQLDLG